MRIKRYKKFTRLEVLWADITQDPKWHSVGELEDAKTSDIKTLGYFLANRKRGNVTELHLGQSIAEDGESDFIAIPYGCIQRIEEL
jgi:hypothetical protein